VPTAQDGKDDLDRLVLGLDLTRLDAKQFIQVLETLDMLGRTGAGLHLSSLSTDTLVEMVDRASKEQIQALAEHFELRYLFLDEIFRRMSEQLRVEKVDNVDAVVSWRFSDGFGDDGFDRYQTVIENNTCVSGADLGRIPDATITMTACDFIGMVASSSAAMAGMLVTRKMKVKGDYALIANMIGYFDMPKPA
jgi:alkyl sulfatase BDS1-like metallo-beta-lactamase superfamily hydrolase